MEVRSIKGMSSAQADAYGDLIITSMGDIVTNQLAKGMTCNEINEFVNETLAKSLGDTGVAGIKFQVNKYLTADCSIKTKSSAKTK